MADMIDYLGSEPSDEDTGYLQPRLYRIKAKCGRCGKTFSWKAKTPGGPNKPCPNAACQEAMINEEAERRARNIAKIIAEQRPPGHIGDKAIVKAIDTTAEIVMQDHGLTNLQDNIRMGDSMAPKLPGKMQQAADGFFGGSNMPSGGQLAKRMNARVSRALRGGGIRVNPSVVAPGVAQGEQAVRRIGVSPNSGAGPNAR